MLISFTKLMLAMESQLSTQVRASTSLRLKTFPTIDVTVDKTFVTRSVIGFNALSTGRPICILVWICAVRTDI